MNDRLSSGIMMSFRVTGEEGENCKDEWICMTRVMYKR